MPTPTRPPGVRVVNLSLDAEAVELLKACAPTTKAIGRFVSRLVYEHAARLEERRRLRSAVVGALDEAGDAG